MKKPFNKYFIILVLGVILWVAETAYFGFNKLPQSGLEGLLDALSGGMMAYGLIGDLMRNVRITKSYHNVTNIQTKKVEFQDEAKVMSYNVNYKNTDKAKK